MLSEKLEKIYKIDNALDDLQHKRIMERMSVIESVSNALAPYAKSFELPWLDFRLGPHAWDCVDSPIGKCIYHTAADPAWDDCILCHQPFERK